MWKVNGKHLLLLGGCMGLLYFGIEGVWRIPAGGNANIVMALVGGICGVLIGMINEIPKFQKMPIFKQSFLGSVLVLLVELIAGLILNVWLGLGIWDYSTRPFNVLGQICLQYSFYWYLLMPLAICVEDNLRSRFWHEKEPYGVFVNYQKLIRGE